MRIVEIELSVLRLSALLASLISPVATWETRAITMQRQHGDDRAPEDHQQQDQDQHQRGQQHDLLGPLAGLLAVQLLGGRPGHPLAQDGPGHQRLDVGTQHLDRVTGGRTGTVDHIAGHGHQGRLHQPVRRGRASRDAHDVVDVLAAERRRDRGDLRRVGAGQPAAIGPGKHDDGRRRGHVPSLRERLVLQARRADRLVALGQEAAFVARGRQARRRRDHRDRDHHPGQDGQPRVAHHGPSQPAERPRARGERPAPATSRSGPQSRSHLRVCCLPCLFLGCVLPRCGMWSSGSVVPAEGASPGQRLRSRRDTRT